jgi:hypothetical protein
VQLLHVEVVRTEQGSVLKAKKQLSCGWFKALFSKMPSPDLGSRLKLSTLFRSSVCKIRADGAMLALKLLVITLLK